MDENPYTSPAAPEPQPVSAQPAGYPVSVILAIMAAGLYAMMAAFMIGAGLLAGRFDAQHLATATVVCLVLLGLLKRHRLAWQWGRLIAGIATAFMTAAAGIALMTRTTATPQPDASSGAVPLAALLLVLVLFGTIFLSLGTTSAHEYFRLRCPECGRLTTRAADFLFNRAKCSCGNVW